jgi:hypothetical protein
VKAVWHVRPLLLIGLLTGCSLETGSSHSERPGMTDPQQLQRDQNECVAQSIDGTSQGRGGLVRVNRDSYRQCMEQRGYTLG